VRKVFWINLTLTLIFFITLISVCWLEKDNAVIPAGADSDYGTVVIDAGHGGEDGGAVGKYGIIEKDINLEVSKRLELILNLFGVNTEMIRREDISLGDASSDMLRQRKVNDIKKRVDRVTVVPQAILVSIHQNSFPEDSSCKGAQVFYSSNNTDSEMLAKEVRSSLKIGINGSNNREIKAAGKNIYLLNNVNCPAILVECGFISNGEEASLLAKNTYQTKLSVCIAAGIVNHNKRR